MKEILENLEKQLNDPAIAPEAKIVIKDFIKQYMDYQMDFFSKIEKLLAK